MKKTQMSLRAKRSNLIDRFMRLLRRPVGLLAMTAVVVIGLAGIGGAYETWANWSARLTSAFKAVPRHKLPGRTMGILVPADDRDDILPLSAFAYQMLSRGSFHTVLIFLQAPPGSNVNGIAVPTVTAFDTTFGRFLVDTGLRDRLLDSGFPVTADPLLFGAEPPEPVRRQLAFLKNVVKGDSVRLKVLPMYVKFSDANAQVRDYAPFLVDRLREYGVDGELLIIIASDLAYAASPEKIVDADNRLLRAVRNLDVDALIEWQTEGPDGVVIPHLDALLMGLLTLRWSGADHGEVAAYGNSSQLVLTKDKRLPIGYAAAGFASAPPIQPRLAHVDQERMLNTFIDPLRIDILTLTRQACLSALDPTAAKPPALRYRQGSKPWPVYVTIIDAQGKMVAQAGSHEATGPLEESLRRYAVECVRRAGTKLDRATFKACVVEVSIPFGFSGFSNPDHLIPLLNGAVLTWGGKSVASPPDAWRRLPDPHQLLAELAVRLDQPPWSYALSTTRRESFRTFSFNEKEPFPAMIQPEKQKKRKGGGDEELPEENAPSGGGGGMFTF
jgi:AmmeMemoRadiSam system protein B